MKQKLNKNVKTYGTVFLTGISVNSAYPKKESMNLKMSH